ncbi:MAG: 1-acyl-sn-glycerol-3-phosphate acyltransferase [Candidatus Marinimicrobia bacterium]|jgi:1-acyl-sn-glycerol-3-phosphate acyltransferase|nr:1-acyl-sn-glycerol-3-phosphate acyltransferase [Candidatus Neomarinimicrobiota bacterium]MCK9483076.1 1-acyl-sn-glycerol-3-phosphate acyltransferase [Candidatus Neomarinimicrobiota bacterium]MCK9559237.1 1-acyl-sn-glycerol-3-phosphate acyltransferase [Candidatus Neomarinimicrobiota bacterium]MDD5061266.1 lysophospholipid acyltransferase family protein [Candidatus Neomarinimicrobiota bacterium]MDD5230440.1 lysophospholipid acyltransferase family protein [Candidatus Neomarinimicrobiota bacteri
MKTLIYIGRWIVGFVFFFLLAATIFIGLIFWKPSQVYILVQPICRIALRAIGVRIKVNGWKNFDPRRPYLIICNHESLLDAFICPAYIPMYFTTLELADHFKWPVWGWMIRRWGHIPISKGNPGASLDSLQKAAALLKSGTSILIFPEGSRTTNGKMQSFKKGAFYLADQAQADILPLAINGLWRAKTRGDWHLRSTNVSLTFGRPIPYTAYQHLSADTLRDLGFKTIQKLKLATDTADFPSGDR